MKREQWKDVAGFEGLYMISDVGRIKSLAHGIIRSNGFKQTFKERIIANREDINGYLIASLCRKAKYDTVKVHRLVAQAFLSNPENKPDVNHKNLDKKDNRLENLEWNTRGENIRHAIKNGVKIGKSRPGKLNPNWRHGRCVKK